MGVLTLIRRLRRSFVALGAAVGVVFLLGVTSAVANLPGSTFEGNDGNLVVNTAGNHDWVNAPNLSAGQDIATGQGDNSLGNGTKEDETAVTVVAGSIPNNKADLARFAIAGESIGPDSYLYLAWSRENQSGTVNFDFEINAVAQPDLTTPGAKTLNRTVNDLLINYSFQGGSNTPSLSLRKWTGSAWGAETPISSTCSEGATNATPVSENLGGFPAVDRPAQQFGEAAINMTCAGIIPPNSCESFADAYVKSRSSTSFQSEIKDFIAPVALHLSACGSITVIKHTNPRGLDQAFAYTTTGGLDPATFSLNDAGNSAGGDSAGNTRTYSSLHSGTYSVTEDADPLGFAFNNVTCSGGSTSIAGRTATINLAAGDNVVCTYVNDQQLGAIKVMKSSVKGQALAGAVFSIAGQSVTTGADGTACVDHLTFGSYNVQETAAPPGYSIDDNTVHSVTVNANETCANHAVDLGLSFNDTPLTDIHITADSQAVGGTQSQITCVDDAAANIGDSPSGNVEHASVSAPGLSPGTYTCTVVVDP